MFPMVPRSNCGDALPAPTPPSAPATRRLAIILRLSGVALVGSEKRPQQRGLSWGRPCGGIRGCAGNPQSQTRDFDDRSVHGTASKPFSGPEEAGMKPGSPITRTVVCNRVRQNDRSDRGNPGAVLRSHLCSSCSRRLSRAPLTGRATECPLHDSRKAAGAGFGGGL